MVDPQRHTHHFIGHPLRCHVLTDRPAPILHSLFVCNFLAPSRGFLSTCQLCPQVDVMLIAVSNVNVVPFPAGLTHFKLYRETDIIPSGAVGRTRDGEGSDNDEVAAGRQVNCEHQSRHAVDVGVHARCSRTRPSQGPSKRVTRCASIQSVFVSVVTLPNCTMGETNYSKVYSVRPWLLETYIEVTTSQP